MSDVFETKAKKIAADQVEVVDAHGTHIAGKAEEPTNPFQRSGVHVVKMGSLGGLGALILLPVLIPVALIGIFLLAIFAILFGKTFFKAGMSKFIRK